MADHQNEAEKLVREEGSKEVTAISKAKSSIEMYATEADISVVKLNNDYNARRNELIEAWDGASAREKKLYEGALKNLTGAYLDRLAHVQPDKLSRTTQQTIKESASLFNTRKELGMKKTIDNWSGNAKGYMSESYRENISDTLKLK